ALPRALRPRRNRRRRGGTVARRAARRPVRRLHRGDDRGGDLPRLPRRGLRSVRGGGPGAGRHAPPPRCAASVL
ncbi:MAG: hypothetical protein AVDCRST_MAG85-3341, partial [uncultured Solirubrobacteraceae bacterium]